MRIPLSIMLALLAAPVTVSAGDIGASVTFSRDEAAIILAWYRDHAATPAQGKTRGSLPPGVAKNLRRGKALPPGIARQALPSGLVSSLPPVRSGFERIVVDGKILLVEIATRVVHDILSDAILR